MELINLAIKTIFVENAILAFFLGMCSFLAVSKKVTTAVGLGFAVIFVSGITVPTNWFIFNYFLREGALSWAGLGDLDLSFLTLIAQIAVIAAMVQLVEMIIETASAKIRDVGVEDEPEDHYLNIWAGLIPIKQLAQYPIADEGLPQKMEIPPHVLAYYQKNSQ